MYFLFENLKISIKQGEQKTAKSSRNSILRSKENTNKVPSNIFRDLEIRKKVRLVFREPKYSMKGKYYVFRG